MKQRVSKFSRRMSYRPSISNRRAGPSNASADDLCRYNDVDDNEPNGQNDRFPSVIAMRRKTYLSIRSRQRRKLDKKFEMEIRNKNALLLVEWQNHVLHTPRCSCRNKYDVFGLQPQNPIQCDWKYERNRKFMLEFIKKDFENGELVKYRHNYEDEFERCPNRIKRPAMEEIEPLDMSRFDFSGESQAAAIKKRMSIKMLPENNIPAVKPKLTAFVMHKVINDQERLLSRHYRGKRNYIFYDRVKKLDTKQVDYEKLRFEEPLGYKISIGKINDFELNWLVKNYEKISTENQKILSNITKICPLLINKQKVEPSHVSTIEEDVGIDNEDFLIISDINDKIHISETGTIVSQRQNTTESFIKTSASICFMNYSYDVYSVIRELISQNVFITLSNVLPAIEICSNWVIDSIQKTYSNYLLQQANQTLVEFNVAVVLSHVTQLSGYLVRHMKSIYEGIVDIENTY